MLVRLPAIGSNHVVAAEHEGFEPTSQTVKIGANDQAFALALVPQHRVMDAGVMIDAASSTAKKTKRPAKPEQPTSGSSGAPFSPNEVGGD